jgi:hypothetical protein
MKVMLLGGTHVTDAARDGLRETLAQLRGQGWDAQTLLGKPIVSHCMHQLAGTRRWNSRAKLCGSGKLLKHRPSRAVKVTR